MARTDTPIGTHSGRFRDARILLGFPLRIRSVDMPPLSHPRQRRRANIKTLLSRNRHGGILAAHLSWSRRVSGSPLWSLPGLEPGWPLSPTSVRRSFGAEKGRCVRHRRRAPCSAWVRNVSRNWIADVTEDVSAWMPHMRAMIALCLRDMSGLTNALRSPFSGGFNDCCL